jgi:hypothetical protein
MLKVENNINLVSNDDSWNLNSPIKKTNDYFWTTNDFTKNIGWNSVIDVDKPIYSYWSKNKPKSFFNRSIVIIPHNVDEVNDSEKFILNYISEKKILDILKNNSKMSEILSDYVNKIEYYLDKNNEFHDIEIVLQEDPEDLNFKAFIILINTEFNNLKERFKIERGIANSLNDLRKDILNSDCGKTNEMLNNISFLVIKDECR